MDPSYETVVDIGDLAWTFAVYVLHGGIVVLQTSLACFLVGTGAHNLLLPRLESVWLRRLGAIGIDGARSRSRRLPRHSCCGRARTI